MSSIKSFLQEKEWNNLFLSNNLFCPPYKISCTVNFYFESLLINHVWQTGFPPSEAVVELI